MIGSSQGLNIEAQDWREYINYPAAMNPRPKEELLMKHLGGRHGDGGASGNQSSLRRGAGTGTSPDPDLGIAMTAEQWRKCGKGVLPRDFPKTWNK